VYGLPVIPDPLLQDGSFGWIGIDPHDGH
jgi:hypothetical protein